MEKHAILRVSESPTFFLFASVDKGWGDASCRYCQCEESMRACHQLIVIPRYLALQHWTSELFLGDLRIPFVLFFFHLVQGCCFYNTLFSLLFTDVSLKNVWCLLASKRAIFSAYKMV